jgi:hypothetical protein
VRTAQKKKVRKMLERRYSQAEIRVSKSGRRASGYIMRWNTKSKPSSGLPFTEICAERCCTNALRTGDPVLLLDHNMGQVLGRQSAKTVRFSEDNSGLEFDCELPNSPLGDNVAESLRRGDLQSCSFGFSMNPDIDPDCESWEDGEDEEGERCVVRTLRKISKLHEASIVASPAYPGTSASVRSMFPNGMPLEIRSRYPKLVLPTLEQIAAVERDELLHRIKKSFV